MDIQFKYFNELTLDQLYLVLKLRTDIFVVEQNCPYPELDDRDQVAVHLLGYIDNKLAGYARIFNSNDYFDGYASLGRILSLPEHRGKGLGKIVVQGALDYIYQKNGPEVQIKIAAQTYLTSFYNALGFKVHGEEFLEDGIPHIYMIK